MFYVKPRYSLYFQELYRLNPNQFKVSKFYLFSHLKLSNQTHSPLLPTPRTLCINLWLKSCSRFILAIMTYLSFEGKVGSTQLITLKITRKAGLQLGKQAARNQPSLFLGVSRSYRWAQLRVSMAKFNEKFRHQLRSQKARGMAAFCLLNVDGVLNSYNQTQ